MDRLISYALLLTVPVGVLAAQWTRPQFEIASIKRTVSDLPASTTEPQPNAASGQLVLNWTPARNTVVRAFPELSIPAVIDGLPGGRKPNATTSSSSFGQALHGRNRQKCGRRP